VRKPATTGESVVPGMDSIFKSMLYVLVVGLSVIYARPTFVQNSYIETKVLSKPLTQKVWLPGMDSNHDSRLQRPLSYH
jgi:hypothetical protein